MPTDTLHVAIDIPQPRIVGDRLAHVVTGRDWDLPASTNAGVDNITYTGMLLPLPYDPLWITNPTGNYARLRKAELSIAGNAAWTEYERAYTGDWYVHSKDVNTEVETLESYERNRPMFLSWINYNSGNEAIVSMDCGWGAGTAAEVSLRFWSNGDVDIYKNAEKVGTAKINERVYYPPSLGPQQFESASTAQMLPNQVIDVLLIPCRRGELLCLSNMGGGFNFFFDDIDPEDPDPTITGAGPFRFQVPQGQCTVQVAPLHFRTTGVLLSPAFQYRDPPGSGETHTETISYDLPGYGAQSADVSLVEQDGVTTFTPDGTTDIARIRVDLTGDGDSTPFVYVASSSFNALTAELPGDGTNIDEWWMQLELDVPEDPEQVRCDITVKNAPAVEAAGVGDMRVFGNRDIEVKIGELSFFIGRSGDTEYEDTPSDETQEFVFECGDRMRRMQNYRIQDPEPVDAFNFSDGLTYFARMPGFTLDDLDIEFIDYTLPALSKSSDGEFALLPEVGDTPAQWIRKLWEEFAQKCLYGWVPTVDGVKFRFATPEGLGSESQFTVYLTEADSIADGHPAGDYKRRAYFSKPRVLLPEANDIHVIGRNPRTRLPIVAHYRDFNSIDPTLDPGDRPDNWIGELRQFGYVDPSLTSDADVMWVLGNFSEVLPVRREIRELRCQFLQNPLTGVPLWRGDCITVRNRGVYRIKTLSLLADLEKAHETDANLDRIWRETRYIVEYVRAEG